MWDEPEKLTAIANFLFLAVAVAAGWVLMSFASHLPMLQPKLLKVEGMTDRLNRDEVVKIAARRLGTNFFEADIDGMKSDFEAIPWVRKVTVSRRWPLEIDVRVEEHVPIANWDGSRMVNTYGEVFGATEIGTLPRFTGPEGSSKDVSREYVSFSKTLASLDRKVVEVNLSDRRSWEIRLDDGMLIELGREKMEKRLSDFAALYDRTVGSLGRRVDYVDLRYENGFAVRAPGLKLRSRGAA